MFTSKSSLNFSSLSEEPHPTLLFRLCLLSLLKKLSKKTFSYLSLNNHLTSILPVLSQKTKKIFTLKPPLFSYLSLCNHYNLLTRLDTLDSGTLTFFLFVSSTSFPSHIPVSVPKDQTATFLS